MDIVDLFNMGAETAAGLNDVACLQKAAEQFLGAYAMFDGYGVVPASAIAERVLGAAMMLNPGIAVGGLECTVVFDVNLASGTLLARAARQLRDSGNSGQIVGIALHSLIEWNADASLGDFDQLVVAHPSCRAGSSAGECGDRRSSGLESALR